jgi:hypothetical protein
MQPNEITIWGITLPTVIAAALMGSALTLLGVFLQNVFESYRNNKKLNHEAGQKNRDREMTLRRDVYLEAASEMAKAARYIAKFGDLNLPFAEHEAIVHNFGAAFSKVHMIAGMETLSKVIEASDTFARINLELNQLRFSLLLDQKNISFLQKSVEDDIAQQKNLVDRIGQLQTANPNHPDISALAATFQELESRIQRTRQRHSELNSKTMTSHLGLSSVVFKRTMSFAEKLIQVNVALRKELNFDLKEDEENYKKSVFQSQAQATKEMDKYIADITKIVEEKKKELHVG